MNVTGISFLEWCNVVFGCRGKSARRNRGANSGDRWGRRHRACRNREASWMSAMGHLAVKAEKSHYADTRRVHVPVLGAAADRRSARCASPSACSSILYVEPASRASRYLSTKPRRDAGAVEVGRDVRAFLIEVEELVASPPRADHHRGGAGGGFAAAGEEDRQRRVSGRHHLEISVILASGSFVELPSRSCLPDPGGVPVGSSTEPSGWLGRGRAPRRSPADKSFSRACRNSTAALLRRACPCLVELA